MSRPIYTDDETRILEKELLEKNPKTNFSQIYKLAIFQLSNKEPTKDIEFKKNKVLGLKAQRTHLDADIKILTDEIKEIDEESKSLLLAQREEKERYKNEQLEKMANHYEKYFHISKVKADMLSTMWEDEKKDNPIGWVEYGIKMGYTFDEKLFKEES